MMRKLLVFLLGLGVIASAMLVTSSVAGAWREAATQQEREVSLEKRKALLTTGLGQKRTYLHRLADDERFVARVIRERLGYIEEGEKLFSFEEPLGTQK